MDKDVERSIIKSFFAKRLQERILFELSSPSKRSDAIRRLSHSYNSILVEKYLLPIPNPNSDFVEIASLLKKNGSGDSCYAISCNPKIDGRHLPLKEALEQAVGYGLPSFILCIPNKLAYFEAEQEYGPPPRFIVKKFS